MLRLLPSPGSVPSDCGDLTTIPSYPPCRDDVPVLQERRTHGGGYSVGERVFQKGSPSGAVGLGRAAGGVH